MEDDANSTMCPGKKNCLTKSKTKQQKKYLNDTLLNIHNKFINLYLEHSISYTFFTRLKTLWIVVPKVSERDTCLCVIHSNMDMLATKLFKLGIVSYKRVDELVVLICCEKRKNVYNGAVQNAGIIAFNKSLMEISNVHSLNRKLT